MGGSGRQGSKSLSSTAEDSDAALKLDFSKEGWQVVRSKCSRLCTSLEVLNETRGQQERCSLYLMKMKVLCFN
jgi:hypothetical protein